MSRRNIRKQNTKRSATEQKTMASQEMDEAGEQRLNNLDTDEFMPSESEQSSVEEEQNAYVANDHRAFAEDENNETSFETTTLEAEEVDDKEENVFEEVEHKSEVEMQAQHIDKASFSSSTDTTEEGKEMVMDNPSNPSSPPVTNNKLPVMISFGAILVALASTGYGFFQQEVRQKETAALEAKITGIQAALDDVLETSSNFDLTLFDETKADFAAQVANIKSELDSVVKNGQQVSGQIRQTVDSFEGTLQEMNEKLTKQGNALATVQSSAKESNEKSASIEVRMQEFLLEQQASFQEAQSLIKTFKNTTDVQALQLVEVRYLLKMADYKLLFEKDISTATKALQSADQILNTLDDVAFSETQNRIQEVLAQLEQVKLPPREKILSDLDKIAVLISNASILSNSEVAQLRDEFMNRPSNIAASEDSTNGVTQKAWENVKNLFVIKRERVETPALMATEDQFYLNQNIQLQIGAAKNAVLENLSNAYSSSIHQSLLWINTYYDQTDPQVALAIAHLNELKAISLQIDALPSIAAAISAFDASMQLKKGTEQ